MAEEGGGRRKGWAEKGLSVVDFCSLIVVDFSLQWWRNGGRRRWVGEEEWAAKGLSVVNLCSLIVVDFSLQWWRKALCGECGWEAQMSGRHRLTSLLFSLSGV